MFDVVFVSDVFVPGGTSFQLAQNIRLISSLGKRVGIVPVQLPHARGRKPINRFVREVVSAGACEIVAGESAIATELLIIDNPRLMAPDFAPRFKISSRQNVFFVPFPPRDGSGALTYDPHSATEIAHRFCDGDFVWAPVANYVRTELSRLYPDLELSRRDAHPIIDTARYRFNAKLANTQQIAIGRHSRPQRDKWPPNRAQFLKVYPARSPFQVSLLGIDARSLSELIGPVPANYQVHPFDSVEPSHFLRSLDFFVYYHHPSWREALGIATVEAMATGALCILPHYMEGNFEDAAIYAVPNEVRETLHNYHRDQSAYEAQTRRARRFASAEFSARRFARFMADFDIKTPRPTVAVSRRAKPYEAVFVTDFSSPKIFNRAFLDEVVCEAELGSKVAVYNMNKTGAPTRFVVDALKEGRFEVIDGDDKVCCDRLVINDPQRLVANRTSLAWLAAREATLLASYPHGQMEAIDRHLAAAVRPHADKVQWAPRDTHSRMWIEAFDPNLNLLADDWRVRVSEATRRHLRALRAGRRAGVPHVIGIVGLEGADDTKWVIDLAAEPKAAILTCYGERPTASVLDSRVLATGYLGIDMLKWLARLDALLVARDRLKADNPDYLVALAEEIDLPIVTRARNTRLRARSPIMLEGKERAALFRMLGSTKPAPLPASPEVGPAGAERRRRRILFVSQNGTGVGHVVRQLAIARKLAVDHDCIFLTMSQAIAFISAWGFHVEYFPSSVYSGVSHTDWDFWLRKKVELTLDAWSIDCLVFDGNVPYSAVAEAAASRKDLASVWIRRGMWPDSEVDRKRLRSQIYFDLVLEPLDFADEVDTGPTRELRETVRTVPPIQLLEREELLSRREACEQLGLEPDGLNVLVQLGSGNNRDIQSLRETVVRTLGERPEARVHNLRWPISDMPALGSESNADLEVFPMARFFRAFDFCVAAAGYNTAHEVLGFGLPTVFVPNETAGMDNQAARSLYAQDRGVALRATAGDLEAKLRSIMDPDFRGALRRRLRRLKMPNGAQEAADVIRMITQQRV